VISRMRNDDLHWTGSLELNISKTLRARGLGSNGALIGNPIWGESNRHVIDYVT